jgi:hypothetical protein
VFVAATASHNVPLGSVTLTAPGTASSFPFIFRGNHVLVRGSIGGSDSLWFFVDSGAGSHCIDRSRADRLGLKVGTAFRRREPGERSRPGPPTT